MTTVIGQRELRNDSGRIMRALDEGETFVVTRHHVPVGELRPLRRGRSVPTSVLREMMAGVPAVDGAQLRRDADEVLDPWIDSRG